MTYAARLNTYYTRKTEHRCTRCGAELEPGRITLTCDGCANDKKSFYRSRIAQHLCTRCGAQLPADYFYTLCESCKEKNRIAYRMSKGRRERAKGQRPITGKPTPCGGCGEDPVIFCRNYGWILACEDCSRKTQAYGSFGEAVEAWDSGRIIVGEPIRGERYIE